MKWYVDCPKCGGVNLTMARMSVTGDAVFCRDCQLYFSEQRMLQHMRNKPGMDPNAPAFRFLDIKPKAKSDAWKAVFG